MDGGSFGIASAKVLPSVKTCAICTVAKSAGYSSDGGAEDSAEISALGTGLNASVSASATPLEVPNIRHAAAAMMLMRTLRVCVEVRKNA